MKLKQLFIFIFIISYNNLYAQPKCPSCNSNNNDENSYCIDCLQKMKSLPEKEKKKLRSINLNHNFLISNQIQKEFEVKRKKKVIKRNKRNIRSEGNYREKLKNKTIRVNENVLSLGIKKSIALKTQINLSESSSYSDKEWKCCIKNGYAYLTFCDEKIAKIKTEIKYLYYENRSYPLKKNKIKKGMTQQEIQKIFFNPDEVQEILDQDSYTLNVKYYINEPRSLSLQSDKYKQSGDYLNLIFDVDGILIMIDKKKGIDRYLSKRKIY